MGSTGIVDNKKLDEIIERTEEAETPDGGIDAVPPSTPVLTLENFKGAASGNKTLCKICGTLYVDIDAHLTTGKNRCSAAVRAAGFDYTKAPAAPSVVSAVPGFMGAALCGVILRGVESWLEPDFVAPSQEWRDDTAAAIQAIAEIHMGDAVSSPYLIILISFSELAILNTDAIRGKFKNKKLPDPDGLPDGFKGGSPTIGIRRNTGDREDSNS